MNIRSQQILSRIPTGRPASDKLRLAASAVLDLAEGLREHAAKINANPGLTTSGKSNALREHIASKHLSALRQAAGPISEAAAAIKQRLDKVTIPAPDRADSVGAFERAEIRAMLRSLDPLQLQSFLVQNTDPRIEDAVLSMPPVMSGVTQDTYDRTLAQARRRRFGKEMDDVAADQHLVDEANNAFLIARNEAQAIGDLSEREFDAMLQTSRGEVPWLQTQGDGIVRVMPGQATYPVASADEIANGRFYASHEEWAADNPMADARFQGEKALREAQKVDA